MLIVIKIIDHNQKLIALCVVFLAACVLEFSAHRHWKSDIHGYWT